MFLHIRKHNLDDSDYFPLPIWALILDVFWHRFQSLLHFSIYFDVFGMFLFWIFLDFPIKKEHKILRRSSGGVRPSPLLARFGNDIVPRTLLNETGVVLNQFSYDSEVVSLDA